MTSEEYLKRMREYKRQLNDVVKTVVVPIGNELLAITKNRIINDGQDRYTHMIGQYSTKPGYYTRSEFVKKGAYRPTGKKESSAYGTTSRSGKFKMPKRNTALIGGKKVAIVREQGFHYQERKSMYLPGGYKEFRNIQGRRIDKVNVTLSGDTNNRYQMKIQGNKLIFGMTTQKAANIREGMDKRFRTNIYASSRSELDSFNKKVAESQRELYNNSLND